MKKEKSIAFTLTEVLIAVAIVGIIAGLVLPKTIENYQTKSMDASFQREVQTIEDSINSLAVTENKADFFSTIMYKDTTPENYDDSVGMYIKKYLKISKMCDDPKDCFAPTYYQYEAGKSRSEYKPDYKGACAILKNGMSICMLPQIGNEGVKGIIDLNGKKGPNVYLRDLRTFSLKSKTRVGLDTSTSEVISLDWTNLEGQEPCTTCDCDPTLPGCGTDDDDETFEEEIETPKDACTTNPNSLDCCKTKTISDFNDACCTYDEISNSNSACKMTYNINLNICKHATRTVTTHLYKTEVSSTRYLSDSDFNDFTVTYKYWDPSKAEDEVYKCGRYTCTNAKYATISASDILRMYKNPNSTAATIILLEGAYIGYTKNFRIYWKSTGSNTYTKGNKTFVLAPEGPNEIKKTCYNNLIGAY